MTSHKALMALLEPRLVGDDLISISLKWHSDTFYLIISVHMLISV